MREIKFRAWVPSERVMIQHREVIDRAHNQFEDRFNASDIVMQYTGLKDKNGVEIYEGDILQFKYVYSGRVWDKKGFENEPQIKKESVLYRDGKFTIGYSLPIKIAGDNYPYSERDENHAMTWTETYSDFEIIGNIHQTPELL